MIQKKAKKLKSLLTNQPTEYILSGMKTQKVYTTKKISKWQSVYNTLSDSIKCGKFSSGEKFYTLNELCHKYDISNITARRVFKELKSNRLIATTGVRGTLIADSKSSPKSRVLLCLSKTASIGLSYYKLFRGFYEIEADWPFEIFPVTFEYLKDHIDEISDNVIFSAGIIVDFDAQNRVSINYELLDKLKKLNPIMIHCFKNFDGIPCIESDYYKGFYDLTTHLINKGHRNIAFVTPGPDLIWQHERFRGYLDALNDSGIILRTELVKTNPNKNKNCIESTIDELLSLGSPPTAMMCSNDRFAFWMLDYCKKKGIKVPKQLAITGFDNVGQCEISRPALTTADSNLGQHSKEAIKLLGKRLAGIDISNEFIKIAPKLIIREST